MPWVNVVLAKPCTPQDQTLIKQGLADLLYDVLGKEERGLVLTFTTADGFFRGGAPAETSAMVDMRYMGSFEPARKQELTRRVAGLLAGTLSLDLEKVVLVITEVQSENWGRVGLNA
ncbi:MAG: tautomerase family protein [Anaerolineae bacterium]